MYFQCDEHVQAPHQAELYLAAPLTTMFTNGRRGSRLLPLTGIVLSQIKVLTSLSGCTRSGELVLVTYTPIRFHFAIRSCTNGLASTG